ncbi:MAG TPA: thioredoxin domain-containing protein [Patescibacteria group bacterium]|nr:thioredoxin domain-containing protein [Patescibacteria group bacterium]
MDDQHLTKDEKKKLRQQEWQQQLDAESKKKLRNRILTWGIGALILVFAVWFLAVVMNPSNTPSTNPTATIKMPPVTSSDIQTGNPNAPLTLVEYADFQCPSCGAYYPIVKQIQQAFGSKLRFVYRFFPLVTIHQNALVSAEAAYAANKQGKFWQMHDYLFEHQQDWSSDQNARDTMVKYAGTLGLNQDTFQKDLNDPATEKAIKASMDSALAINLQGTPSFFINGTFISTNPNGYDDFKALLQAKLNNQ